MNGSPYKQCYFKIRIGKGTTFALFEEYRQFMQKQRLLAVQLSLTKMTGQNRGTEGGHSIPCLLGLSGIIFALQVRSVRLEEIWRS